MRKYVSSYVSRQIHSNVCVHTGISCVSCCTYFCTNIYIYIYMCVCVCVCVCVFACVCLSVSAYMYISIIHIPTHTHKCTHTDTHTHILDSNVCTSDVIACMCENVHD